MVVAALVIAIVIGGLFATSSLWVTWWWYGSLGYRSVLVIQYIWGAIFFVVFGAIAAAFYWANWRYARSGPATSVGRPGLMDRIGRVVLIALTVGVGVVSGWRAAQRWDTYRLFLAGSDFGVRDPIFNRDAGFYVFSLPALLSLWRGATALIAVTLVTAAVVYLLQQMRRGSVDPRSLGQRPKTHLLALAGVLLLLIGIGYLLENYELQYSRRGFAFGVGFTDATVVRPLHWLLFALSVVAAAIVLLNARSPRIRPLFLTAVVWVVAVLLGAVLPNIVQQSLVEPNQLSREQPYIANNIALTRAAYGLDGTETRDLSGQGEPQPSQLSADSPTFDNIRLWDYRIVRQTFQQLQSFVPFYVFDDVDIDRYQIDGTDRQVLISARELDTSQLTANAQTWVNLHLSYTHGYGVVVSPISEATSQGLPVFLVGNIPPQGTGALAITRPEIYFGETPGNWVAIGADADEISGIPGVTKAEPHQGPLYGGIQVGSFVKRILLAAYLKDSRVWLSGELRPDSQLLIRHSITDMAQAVVPFLQLDPDPYLAIVNGRLIWIVDAYATTDRFPGATPLADGDNYIRNTARLTIDAYSGQVTVYRTAVPDPITDAYARIYPGVFHPISEAPPELARHFRYPERLFDIQTEMFASYHVTDPAAFYNGEDRWDVARESVAGATQSGETQEMEAYYMTLPLPGETEANFKIVRPFTPNNRQNMTAWMAGQWNPDGSPRLVVFRFPRQENVFGPQQVEARINQDPQISSQITLLDQSGSRVLRGNLLVIPIGETVLYVQPMYLQATASSGAPPELRFVIVATQGQVEMRPTLEAALAAIASDDAAAASGQPAKGATTSPAPAPAPVPTNQTAARAALTALDQAQQARDAGDLNGYEASMLELRRLLEAMSGTPVAAPAPAAPAATPAGP
jgi:uncharacterized membrane protein (UPF0182 family)